MLVLSNILAPAGRGPAVTIQTHVTRSLPRRCASRKVLRLAQTWDWKVFKNMALAMDINQNMPMVFYFCCIYLSSPTQDLVKVTSPLQCMVKNMCTCKEVIVPCCLEGFSAMLTLELSAFLPWGMIAWLQLGRMPCCFGTNALLPRRGFSSLAPQRATQLGSQRTIQLGSLRGLSAWLPRSGLLSLAS